MPMRPTIPWNNNISLLRLLLASMVVLVHCQALSQAPSLARTMKYISAEMAVQAFFVLSGFLVVMSYEQSRDMREYLGKRARRIYPAYVLVILTCAVGGVWVSTLPWQDYFNGEWVRYLMYNLVFLNFRAPVLPGVFDANPLPFVNGALWTIKLEVMFYLLVPLLCYVLNGRRRAVGLLLIYVLSLAYRYYCPVLFASGDAGSVDAMRRQLPGQLCYFMVGTALYYYFDQWRAYMLWYMLAALAVLVLTLGGLPFGMLQPAVLGIGVMGLAFGLKLPDISSHGDYSYGLYIWHFPVIQLLIMLGVFAVNPWLGVAVAFALTGMLAMLSWHGVEKPCLRPSSHYVAATKP